MTRAIARVDIRCKVSHWLPVHYNLPHGEVINICSWQDVGAGRGWSRKRPLYAGAPESAGSILSDEVPP